MGEGISWEKNCVEAVLRLAHHPRYERRSKKREQDFTRKRKMSFAELLYFMLGMVKDSTQNALSRFFQQAGKADIHMR
jgi:hypothetical protein